MTKTPAPQNNTNKKDDERSTRMKKRRHSSYIAPDEAVVVVLDDDEEEQLAVSNNKQANLPFSFLTWASNCRPKTAEPCGIASNQNNNNNNNNNDADGDNEQSKLIHDESSATGALSESESGISMGNKENSSPSVESLSDPSSRCASSTSPPPTTTCRRRSTRARLRCSPAPAKERLARRSRKNNFVSSADDNGKQQPSINSQSFPCRPCKLFFLRAVDFLEHESEHHSKRPNFRCPDCHDMFMTWALLADHPCRNSNDEASD